MPKKRRDVKKSDADAAWNRRKELTELKLERNPVHQSFLIVCDGPTESSYFESFRLRSCIVKCVPTKSSKLELVAYTEELAKEEKYDQIWCVFDMDFTPNKPKEKASFDNAIAKAKSLCFHAGWSNDCFELWFYLHYKEQNSYQLRTFYYTALKKIWKLKATEQWKEKDEAKRTYERLTTDIGSSQQKAIVRAEKLILAKPTEPPNKQNPATTVHLLVKELNKFLRG